MPSLQDLIVGLKLNLSPVHQPQMVHKPHVQMRPPPRRGQHHHPGAADTNAAAASQLPLRVKCSGLAGSCCSQGTHLSAPNQESRPMHWTNSLELLLPPELDELHPVLNTLPLLGKLPAHQSQANNLVTVATY